jgi:hypothetical protein
MRFLHQLEDCSRVGKVAPESSTRLKPKIQTAASHGLSPKQIADVLNAMN